MKTIITYNEILDYIESQYLIRPQLVTINERTVDLRYKLRLFIPTINIRLHIESVCKNLVTVHYNCNDITSFIIQKTIENLKQKLPDGIEINSLNKHISINLYRLKKLEKVFKYVMLSDLAFDENAIVITAVTCSPEKSN